MTDKPLDEALVKIDLYNSLGRHVTTLCNAPMKSGTHLLEINLSSPGVESGIYFINSQINDRKVTQKLVYTRP